MSCYNSYLDTFITIILTVILTLIAEYFINQVKKKLEKIKIETIGKNLSKINELINPLTIVQFGKFTPGSIEIHVIGSKSPSEDVKKIIEAHKSDFESELGFYDNEIFGVTKILFEKVREKEEPHLEIYGYRVYYFEFLATNANIKLRNDLNKNERDWLLSKTANYEPEIPIKEFANPLSVEVLLLCEGGKKVVLTKRSKTTVFRGGLIGPSVMETVSPNLSEGLNDIAQIDIFETIRRGIKEELGINKDELEDSIVILGLAFDKEVFDYKFIVLAETLLSEEEIKSRFNMGIPRDRYENPELLIYDFPFPIKNILNSKQKYSPEAVACLILSIAFLKGWKYVKKKL